MWRLAAYSPVFLLPIIFWVANFVRPDHHTADDDKDNWLQSDGVEKSVKAPNQNLGDQWAMIMHAKFTKRQGQGCMNLCVLCPHDEDGELTTVSISRAKSARDLVKTTVIAPVDTVLGTANGAIVGADKGLLTGLSHGIGMVKKFTKCGRVGFDRNTKGQAMPSQPLHSPAGKDYGLKKLRSWNAQNTPLPGDADATRHCERLRDQSFDMRHAMDCVKHSKIYSGPGVVLPAYKADTCRKMSSKEDLKQCFAKRSVLSVKADENKDILEQHLKKGSILTEVSSHEATLEHPADDAEKPAVLEQCNGETEEIDSDSVYEKTKQTEH